MARSTLPAAPRPAHPTVVTGGVDTHLDVHVAALRAKLRDAIVIDTVRGVGYRLRAARSQTV